MSKHRYEVQTCDRCDRPIGVSENLEDRIKSLPKHGIVVTLGFSLGGFGRRQNWLDYGAEVCNDCFEKIQAVLEPVIEYIQNPPERGAGGDNIQPLRDNKLEPERRDTPLLCAVSSIHSDAD